MLSITPQFSGKIVTQESTGRKIAYLSGSQFDEWWSQRLPPTERQRYLDRVADTKSGTAGVVTPEPSIVLGEALPAGSIVVRRPLKLDSRYKRIWLGQTLRHEIAHANGADEIGARLADRCYLRKQGLQGPSDEQILGAIAKRNYGFKIFREAFESMQGHRLNLLHAAIEWVRARYSGRPYSLKAELNSLEQNNAMLADRVPRPQT